ncbi:hypothetical protein ACJJIU_19380 [Microbulbifer sp. CnH-101-E]|uniref:hypothetical protein n=1 Tax=unclassified Microbulbifer TaxID=2619833 RepID=UPI0040390B79
MFHRLRKARLFLGWFGLLIAMPFFLWGLAGVLNIVPSMIQYFGVQGIGIPAMITISGFLLAAVGFWHYD